MKSRKTCARSGTVAALKLRRKHGISTISPVDVYRLAELEGVEVSFVDIPSMEGVYLAEKRPLILVSSLRPPGRQAMTCAHELGHHIFRHGAQFDELVEDRERTHKHHPDEMTADFFARQLLMCESATRNCFVRRNGKVRELDARSVYEVATSVLVIKV